MALAVRDERLILAVAIGSALYHFLFGLAGLYGAIHDGVSAMLPNIILLAVIVAVFAALVSRLRCAASADC